MVQWQYIFPDEFSMERIAMKQIIIDPERFVVMKNERMIVLTKTEFSILYLMMSSRGRIQSRKDISRFAWGVDDLKRPRTIDTHISNIRKKVGRVNDDEIITVIKGVGYKLNDRLTE